MSSAVSGLVGGVAGSLFGSSTPSVPNVQVYQPTGTAAADTSYQNLINSNIANNPYAAYSPQATQTFQQQFNNPYAGLYQDSANAAGTAYGTTGTNAVNASGALNTAALAGLPAATQALNLGFDPQSALYKQQLQQLNDQVGANSAARGITNSPYGASVANTADTNFNIDWQNNQLQRALSALSGYSGAVSGAGNQATQAGSLGAQGANALNDQGAVPFTAANNVSTNQNTALTNLLSILGNSGAGAYNSNDLNALMNYLKLGTSQSNEQGQFDLSNYTNTLAASQASQQGIGNLVSAGASAASQYGPEILAAFA